MKRLHAPEALATRHTLRNLSPAAGATVPSYNDLQEWGTAFNRLRRMTFIDRGTNLIPPVVVRDEAVQGGGLAIALYHDTQRITNRGPEYTNIKVYGTADLNRLEAERNGTDALPPLDRQRDAQISAEWDRGVTTSPTGQNRVALERSGVPAKIADLSFAYESLIAGIYHEGELQMDESIKLLALGNLGLVAPVAANPEA